MTMMRNLLYIFVLSQSFLMAYLSIPTILRISLRLGIVDEPGARKVHRTPKPLLGGVGIAWSFFAIVLGNLIAFIVVRDTPFADKYLPSIVQIVPRLTGVLPKLMILLGGGFLMHLLGLLDDIFKEKLSYKFKFLIQSLIAVFVTVAGIRTHFMPGSFLDIIITVVWIVGIANAFNLLDNLDGLTAGVSVISATIFFIVAVYQGQVFFAFILIALAGASLGFLIHNFYPAKLFMGDSGSLFLGYMFGALTVMGSYVVPTSASLMPVLMPVLILSIPLYDTFSVMFIRFRERRPLFLGDKRHFSHRLLELGMSHRGTVVFIYLVCFCVGITATLLPYLSLFGTIVILAQTIIIYILITLLMIIGSTNKNNNNSK